jgi:hypothetical protein
MSCVFFHVHSSDQNREMSTIAWLFIVYLG